MQLPYLYRCTSDFRTKGSGFPPWMTTGLGFSFIIGISWVAGTSIYSLVQMD